MQQHWKRLADGVELAVTQTDKFKTGLLAVALTVPLSADTATTGALIPEVLYRGSRKYPDMEKLSAATDTLYGASLSTGVRQRGESQCVSVLCSFIDDRYALDGSAVLEPAAALMGEVLLDPDRQEVYAQNSAGAQTLLLARDNTARELVEEYGTKRGTKALGLITFHDGFQYFADAYGLTLLAAIEEEAGSEASAHEIVEITQLVREYEIPVIFTEVNGSDATAAAIARETGCQIAQLNMLMDGPDNSIGNYLSGITENAAVIINGFAGKEVVQQG